MHNFRTLAAAMLIGVSALTPIAPANAAAPCRNTHGQFIKCSGSTGVSAQQKKTASVVAQRSAAAQARDGSLMRMAASSRAGEAALRGASMADHAGSASR